MDVDEYKRLKKKVDRLRAESNKAAGALAHLMEELQTVFKCNSVKEAKTKLKEMKGRQKRLEYKYEKELAAFLEQWGSILNEVAPDDE